MELERYVYGIFFCGGVQRGAGGLDGIRNPPHMVLATNKLQSSLGVSLPR